MPIKRKMNHLGDVRRADVRADGDHAITTTLDQGKGEIVVSAEHMKLAVGGLDDILHLLEASAGFLHPYDVRACVTERLDGFGFDVHSGSALDVVENARDVDAFSNRLEVEEQASLGWLVVVGVHQQNGISTHLLGMAAEPDRLGGSIRTGAGDDRDPAVRKLTVRQLPVVFVVAEGGLFAVVPRGPTHLLHFGSGPR